MQKYVFWVLIQGSSTWNPPPLLLTGVFCASSLQFSASVHTTVVGQQQEWIYLSSTRHGSKGTDNVWQWCEGLNATVRTNSATQKHQTVSSFPLSLSFLPSLLARSHLLFLSSLLSLFIILSYNIHFSLNRFLSLSLSPGIYPQRDWRFWPITWRLT